MNIRLIATDLDGTLLGRDKRVSEINARALRACEARGIQVVLASGRGFDSVSHMARGLGLSSPVISVNGARVDRSPEGGTLLMDAMEPGLAERVFDRLLKTGIYFVVYGPRALYQNNLDGHPEERGVGGTMRIGNELKNGAAVRIEKGAEITRAEGLSCALKFVLFCGDADRLALAREQIARETPCSLSSSWFDNLEVLAPGAGKGRALSLLAERRGIAKEQIMAFGDNLNDLDMLRAAGWPVAMENAVPELKAAARLIAPAFDQSGVGQILNQYVLEVE